jgi:hypothetical protein
MVTIGCISLNLLCKLEENLRVSLGLMLRRNRNPVLPIASTLSAYESDAGGPFSWVYELGHSDQKMEQYFLPVIHFYLLSLLKLSFQFTVSRNW